MFTRVIKNLTLLVKLNGHEKPPYLMTHPQ